MGKKILIIDDDPVFVRMIKSRLKASGYHVLSASDGLTGYDLARQMQPDLITLDICMPVLNGYSVCGFLKSQERYRAIPLIMISSECVEIETAFTEDAKPNAFFQKPVNMSQLLIKVEELLR